MQSFHKEPPLNAKAVRSNVLALLAEDLSISDDERKSSASMPPSKTSFKRPGIPKIKISVPYRTRKLLPCRSGYNLLLPDFNFKNIFDDVTQITAVERYFNIIYRPFVCYMNTNCHFVLQRMDMLLDQSKYNSNKHPALIVQRKEPLCNLKVYSHGVIYCESISAAGAYTGLSHFLDEVESLGYSPPRDFDDIANRVSATFAVPFNLNLRMLHLNSVDTTLYCAQTRPFLTYDIPDSLIRLAVFANGFVYVLFSQMHFETRKAIAYIIPILLKFASAKNEDEAARLRSGDIDFKILWENAFQSDKCYSFLYASNY